MNDRLTQWSRSPGFRLAGYLAMTAVTIGILTWMFPWLQQLVLHSPQAGVGFLSDIQDGAGALERPAGTFVQQIVQTGFMSVLVLLGALVFTAPMVWIYTVMLRQEGYDRSFVRMLVMLPIVVAGVVQIVRGDLALAFALTGIVAAVRFRTTVKDLQDAVFAFTGIGIGLATGTGAFALAGAISTVVCSLFYVAWRFNIGEVEPRLEIVATGGTLAEALVPGETQRAVAIGDRTAVRSLKTQDLDVLSAHAERLATYVRTDALRKRKKYRELLLAYTRDPDEARKVADKVLEEHATRWVEMDRIRLNGDQNGQPTMDVLVYLLRLKKDVQIARMVERFQGGEEDPIRAVELKPVTGLRKQLT